MRKPKSDEIFKHFRSLDKNKKLMLILVLNVISTIFFNKNKFMRFFNKAVFIYLIINGIGIVYKLLTKKDFKMEFEINIQK